MRSLHGRLSSRTRISAAARPGGEVVGRRLTGGPANIRLKNKGETGPFSQPAVMSIRFRCRLTAKAVPCCSRTRRQDIQVHRLWEDCPRSPGGWIRGQRGAKTGSQLLVYSFGRRPAAWAGQQRAIGQSAHQGLPRFLPGPAAVIGKAGNGPTTFTPISRPKRLHPIVGSEIRGRGPVSRRMPPG